MKRRYQKPCLEMESFQLNAALALSCSAQGKIPINQGEDACSFGGPGGAGSGVGQFFNLFNCRVDLTGPANDGNDTICYHGPLATGGISFTFS